MSTKDARFSEHTVADARKEAGVMARTVSAPIEHWIRVGRAIESAPAFDDRRIKSALRGDCSPDVLDGTERAIYAVEHEQRMKTASESELEFYKSLSASSVPRGSIVNTAGNSKGWPVRLEFG
jgi:hypothetical protein